MTTKRKTKPKYMYFIVVMGSAEQQGDSALHSRTWCFFDSEKKARDSIVKDAAFYFEHGHYRYALIEKFKVNGFNIGKHVAWFSATMHYKHNPDSYSEYPDCVYKHNPDSYSEYPDRVYKIQEITRPERYDRICDFAMG